MSRDDWRELTYWCALSGAFLIYVVLANIAGIVVAYLLG